MGTFNTKCPHCGVTAEVQSEWVGMEVECPECRKTFVIPPPASQKLKLPRFGGFSHFRKSAADNEAAPEADNVPPRQKKKTQYLWGNMYIALARIFAGLVLLLGAGSAVNEFYEAVSLRRELLDALQAKSEKVVPPQKAFKEHFDRLAEIVLTGNLSEAKFKFPHDLASTEHEFNETLMTAEDIRESLMTAEEYRGKLQKISGIMEQYFQSLGKRMAAELRKGDPLQMKKTSGRKRDTSLSLRLGQNVDFYSLSEEELDKIIGTATGILKILAESKDVDLKKEAEAIGRGLDFINRSLRSNAKALAIRGRQTEERTETVQAGRQKFGRETQLLAVLLKKLAELYDYSRKNANEQYAWQLSEELTRLQTVLEAHAQEIDGTHKTIRKVFREKTKSGLREVLAALILAFLIMVFSDFLQAHLDSADSLHKLCGKGLMLLAMFLLAGCGGEQEKKLLEQQKDDLRKAAIDALFCDSAKDNQDNEGVVSYGWPGEELTIINGGFVAHPDLPSDTGVPHEFVPVTFGRTYNIMRMKIYIPLDKIQFNPIQKTNKPPYTHRTTMVFTAAKQELVQKENVFGLTIQALVPEGFGDWDKEQKEEWVKKNRSRLPADDCDHAIVIDKTPFPDSSDETITKNVDILFNSKTKQWELKNREKIESLLPLPKYDPKKAEALRREGGFTPITATFRKDKPVLYLQNADCEIIRKLNDGQILVNGKWVNAEVYWQTQKLAEVVPQIQSTRAADWPKLERFAADIANSPLAENRAQAAAQMAEWIRKEIRAAAQDKPRQEFIISKLQLDCFNILDRETRENLAGMCKQNIENRNAAERTRIAAGKASLEKTRDGLKEMKNSVRINFNTVLGEAKALDLLNDPEFVRQYNLIRSLILLKKQNRTELSKLVQNHRQIGEYDLRSICRRCVGKGKEPCTYCKNTGVCRICKGTGTRIKYETNADLSSTAHQVECPAECTYCNGQKKPCKICLGLTGFLNEAATADAIEKEKSKFCAWIDTLIAMTENLIKESDCKYDNVGK